jgi:hypothetical protein
MNSACIITACAAHRRTSQGHNNYAYYTTKDYELYYRVHFRMYLHFKPIDIVAPTGEDNYIGSIYAPVIQRELKRVHIDAQSIMYPWSFSVRADKCSNGIDDYIQEHISEYENSSIWELGKEEILNKYLDELKRKYNVILDKNSPDYTIQYCWEVDCE